MLQDKKLEPRPCLVLAGAPMFTFDKVKSLAEELGLLETIRFPGQVSDVSGILSACDIGVLISEREGLSNTILEYMAAGLPVVATELSGNREALGNDAENQFCRIMDPVDLTKKIQAMIRDEKTRKQTGLLNKYRADECFSIQSMCHKTAAVISDLSQDKK